jgi:hypothetical protein
MKFIIKIWKEFYKNSKNINLLTITKKINKIKERNPKRRRIEKSVRKFGWKVFSVTKKVCEASTKNLSYNNFIISSNKNTFYLVQIKKKEKKKFLLKKIRFFKKSSFKINR